MLTCVHMWRVCGGSDPFVDWLIIFEPLSPTESCNAIQHISLTDDECQTSRQQQQTDSSQHWSRWKAFVRTFVHFAHCPFTHHITHSDIRLIRSLWQTGHWSGLLPAAWRRYTNQFICLPNLCRTQADFTYCSCIFEINQACFIFLDNPDDWQQTSQRGTEIAIKFASL